MGMFACFAAPAPAIQSQEQVQQLANELAAARSHVAHLQRELQQVQADRRQLLQQANKVPAKQDTATEMPPVSVAVQAKPPVVLESRIPQPSGEEQNSTTSNTASPEVTVKSRIPTHPAGSQSKGSVSSRANKEAVLESPRTDAAGLIRAVSGRTGQDAQRACTTDPSSLAATGKDSAEIAELEQRIVMLQQQLKVADAFRASLEAQLRDARFANSTLQTQVLSLQTKFEKAVEEQVSELERLETLRKDGQERYDAVASELAQHKRLQDSSAAQELIAYKSQVSAALSRAVDSEAKLSQVTSELQETQQELDNARAQLSSTEELVQHMADKAKATAQQHEQQVQKLEDELKSQKAIYDSTVEEMLQLSSNYNALKQDYHKLQSETKNHDEMVQLVQQELAELSYYAAAGRVALGVAPETCVRNFSTSEVLLAPRGPSDGSEVHLGSLKLSSLLSTDSNKSAALAAVLASRDRPADTATVSPEAVIPVVPESDEERTEEQKPQAEKSHSD